MKNKEKLYGRFRVSKNFLEIKKSDVILSVGCKRAELENVIASEVKRIIAVDVDNEIINKNNNEEKGIIFEYGNVVKGLDYPGKNFDKVIFLEVIEHLPVDSETRALKEIYRVLKKGGILVMSTPNDFWLTKFFDPAFWLINHRHYKIRSLIKILRQAGFKIEKEYIGGKYMELIWLPIYYVLRRLKLAKFIKPSVSKIIDKEYKKPGFQTIILKCRK